MGSTAILRKHGKASITKNCHHEAHTTYAEATSLPIYVWGSDKGLPSQISFRQLVGCQSVGSWHGIDSTNLPEDSVGNWIRLLWRRRSKSRKEEETKRSRLRTLIRIIIIKIMLTVVVRQF